MEIRIRNFSIPYRGKRVKATDHKGRLPYATPWPWQEDADNNNAKTEQSTSNDNASSRKTEPRAS